jgi:ribosomal protein RSM22 (predicted rRNA methylase)
VAYSKTVLENAGISVRSIDSPPLEPYSLLVSHVLNEVSDLQSDLLPWIEKSQNAVWLEPGTPWHSHRLIELRERLRDRFYVWAPCSHSTACGLVKNEKSKDWCHHFADVPSECFQSKEWADFSKELKIDLRSLPVSYLVLSRTPRNLKEFPRVIGRPRKYSGFLKALVCNEDGVIERTATRGKDPKNYKALSKEGFVKHWE